MEKLNQLKGRPVYVDLIRTVAIIGVILLHASGQWLITSQEISQLTPLGALRWSVVDIYQSIGVMGVPLFLMLTGALLLQPEKSESLSTFFKKRWIRIGLPLVFWGAIYFVWVFLVLKWPFSIDAVIQGILNGPYTQFWYIYVLIGLYLLTPILRVIIAHGGQTIIKYFIVLWLIGTAILPFFALLTPFTLSSNIFTITGYVGYFVLGVYLLSVHIRRSTLAILTILGLTLTAFGTYLLVIMGGGTEMYFFQEYLSATVILASVMTFLLLLTAKPPSLQQEVKPSNGHKLIKLISQNTLGIYFVHVIVLESIQLGYLGFTLNRDTLNPIVEVPLMTVIVLFISLAIMLLLKKIPYLKKIVG
jgi:surface polysaccharide O-acyltransferase-like enzyme